MSSSRTQPLLVRASSNLRKGANYCHCGPQLPALYCLLLVYALHRLTMFLNHCLLLLAGLLLVCGQPKGAHTPRAVEQAGRQCLPHTRSSKQHQYLSVSHREWLCCSGPRSLMQSWIWQSKCIFLIIRHWSLLWQKHLIERCGCIPSMQKGCSKW